MRLSEAIIFAANTARVSHKPKYVTCKKGHYFVIQSQNKGKELYTIYPNLEVQDKIGNRWPSVELFFNSI